MVNVGNCLRCCCLMLPLSWTISTFVLSIWILVGSTSTAPFPSDTYFLRMNVSMIDPPVTPPPGLTIAEYIGLHDFYQTGLWSFCEGFYRVDQNWRAVVTACGPTSSGYSFDPISIMATELKSPYTIVFVQSEVDAIQAVQAAAGWHKAAFVITAIFSGFTLIIGPLTGVWHQRKLFNCIPVGTMCVAAVFVFLAACTVTNVFFKLRNSFNDDERLNVQAGMGHQMFAWVWLAVWTAWTAVGQWCCAAICCPGGHRKHRVEFRRPFPGIAGLIPVPWMGSAVERPSSTVAMVQDQDAPGFVPIAPLFPQPPPPPPQQQHHHNVGPMIAAGLTGAAIGATVDHMHQHHHHNQDNPPPANLPAPPVIPIAPVQFNNPPPQQPFNNAPVLLPAAPIQPPMVGPGPVVQNGHHGHGGAIVAAATAGALGLGAGAAIEAHHNRPPPQPQIPPPPPPIVVQQAQQPPILLEPQRPRPPSGQPQVPPPAPIIIPPPLPVPVDPFREAPPNQPPPNQGGTVGQPVPLTPRPVPQTPPVQMPAPPVQRPPSGAAQDNLHENFPYGPGPNMVTNSLDTLFARDPPRQ